MEDKKTEETQLDDLLYKTLIQFEATVSRNPQHSRFGYKATTSELKCCNYFQYEIGKWFIHKKEIVPCESGFHLCEKLIDVFKYYEGESRYFIVEYGDNYIKHGDKIVTDKIRLVLEIDHSIALNHIRAEFSPTSLTGFKLPLFEPWKDIIDLYEKMDEYILSNKNINSENINNKNISNKYKIKYIDECLLIHIKTRSNGSYNSHLIHQLLQCRIRISKFEPYENSSACIVYVYIDAIMFWAIWKRYFTIVKLIVENGGKVTKENINETRRYDSKIAEYLSSFLPKSN